MPAVKLLNIFALSTLAVLLCSFAPSHTLALSIQANHLARQSPNHHHGIAKKKKRDTQRCKPKPSTSSPPVPASSPYDSPAPSLSSTPGSPANFNAGDVTPTSTTPNSVQTTPPATTPSGTGKLAIAWASGNDPRASILLASSRVIMWHVWSADIPDILKNANAVVSIMLWGPGYVDDFVAKAQAGYATHAFGPNEVNEEKQANIDPGTGVSLWYSYLRPLVDKGYTLGAPCTSSNPNGFDWVTTFVDQCGSDCHIDEMPIHYYDISVDGFKAYIDKWAGFKKPIRITEFAFENFNLGDVDYSDCSLQPSMDDLWSFTGQMIPDLENDPRVLSYAPYGFMDDMGNVCANNKLFTATSLTDLGFRYVNGY